MTEVLPTRRHRSATLRPGSGAERGRGADREPETNPGAASPRLRSSYDVVVVGGGHNGLVAAAYLARAGRSVLVLERQGQTGGAAISTRPFPGVDARLSRYAYLVSLLPSKIVRDLGLDFRVRRRTFSSYTPVERAGRPTGLLIGGGEDRTREAFARLTGSHAEFDAWRRFQAMTRRVAERVFPTLTEPLPSRDELRRRVDDAEAWRALFEEPIGAVIEATFADDLVRGVVLTDALIGTFADAHDPSLRQNRCFLYHVIGGGTGDWDVPVGGMGALTAALERAAHRAGAVIVTGHEVTGIAADGRIAEVAYRVAAAEGAAGRVGAGWTVVAEGTVAARHVLVNAAPSELERLIGDAPLKHGVPFAGESEGGPRPGEPATGAPPDAPAGAQLKVNMLLTRLPRLRDPLVDPREAFAGTFHIAEGYVQLATAFAQAAAGALPTTPPSEIYCHSLTDPSILGPDLAERGWQTLTLFGLHAPARLFEADNDAAREALLASTLAQLDEHLAEPIADCLAVDSEGRPCIEAKTPLDLARELGLPGGHIFHQDLAWPWAGEGSGRRDVGSGLRDGETRPHWGVEARPRWGVETRHSNVLLCGAGAIRGGGVSGIPGHNAAMAVLEQDHSA